MNHVPGFNVTSNASTVSQGYQLTLSGPLTIVKYVGIASTDAFADPRFEAQRSSSDALVCGWNVLVNEHVGAWEALWESADIEVPGDQEIQLSARSALFHLRSNIRRGCERTGIGDSSIAPAGLTSDSYAGQVILHMKVLTLDLLGCRYMDVSRSLSFKSRPGPFNY